MHIFADLPLPAIVGVIGSVLTAIVGLITWIARAVFEYLIARIKTLETREQTVLTGLLDSIESITGTTKATAEFVVALADDRRYQEKRNEERRRGDEDRGRS